ncbi:hypothetical protein ACLKA6_009737 [Drosophila palustris]
MAQKPASFLPCEPCINLHPMRNLRFQSIENLMRDFYVDDLISGGDSTQEALEIAPTALERKADWDELSSLNSSWLTLSADLGRTQQLRFPRRAHLPKSAVEIHGFCDASIDAFEDASMLFQWQKEGVQLSFSVPGLEWPH